MNMNILTQLAVTITSAEAGIPNTDGDMVIFNILNLAYFVAGIIAVIVIIIAGFTMTTNGSDPGAVGKAKNSILYAVIGIIVILAAFGITAFVRGSISG
jgi:Type IV secretion system pilin